MHDYRAIFLDIDGTLTQPGHSAPPVSAVAAIESARRAGRRVFLCTGRCEAMLKPLLHCADLTATLRPPADWWSSAAATSSTAP